jgi:hypothetical protein
VLFEMGLELADDVQITVHDSSSAASSASRIRPSRYHSARRPER